MNTERKGRRTMGFTVRELAEKLQADVRGDVDAMVDDVASLAHAGVGHLTFVDSPKQLGAIAKCQAAAILVTPDVAERVTESSAALLVVNDPFGSFIQTMLEFRPPRVAEEQGISPLAIVHPTAKIGAGTRILAGAIIEAGVSIGNNCVIMQGAVVREGCHIGNNCTLHPQVVMYPDVTLGNRVILHAHAVIGADGFGYRFQQGRFVRIPHTGTVQIQDDVEIGAGATIDRGMIEATVIGEGTKLDNLVMIAHNCRIGRHNAFASQVGLAGSVTTGDYVRAGGQVGVADHITIGTGVSFGGKAGVITNVPDGATYHGIPAGPEKEEIRRVLTLRKAPQVFEQVKELRQQVNSLQAQLATLLSGAESGDSNAA